MKSTTLLGKYPKTLMLVVVIVHLSWAMTAYVMLAFHIRISQCIVKSVDS